MAGTRKRLLTEGKFELRRKSELGTKSGEEKNIPIAGDLRLESFHAGCSPAYPENQKSWNDWRPVSKGEKQ